MIDSRNDAQQKEAEEFEQYVEELKRKFQMDDRKEVELPQEPPQIQKAKSVKVEHKNLNDDFEEED